MKRLSTFAFCGTAMLCASAHADISYFNNFNGGAGPEWSTSLVETSPNEAHRFLGQFGNETISLTLANVGAGSQVSLAFDFLAIRTWDGNAGVNVPGPDVFTTAVRGGPILVSSTFSVGDPESRQRMSYPSPSGIGSFVSRTGAVSANDLGYTFRGVVLDATWRMNFTFTAPTNDVTIDFGAIGLQSMDDESWGLDNVSVSSTTVPAPGALALLCLGGTLITRRRRD
jgi:hypothetical protein